MCEDAAPTGHSFEEWVCGALLLSSPVTLSRNGWVVHSTGHSFEEWVCEVFRCLLLGLCPMPLVTLLRAGWVGSSVDVESWRVPPCGAAAGLLLLTCP